MYLTLPTVLEGSRAASWGCGDSEAGARLAVRGAHGEPLSCVGCVCLRAPCALLGGKVAHAVCAHCFPADGKH